MGNDLWQIHEPRPFQRLAQNRSLQNQLFSVARMLIVAATALAEVDTPWCNPGWRRFDNLHRLCLTVSTFVMYVAYFYDLSRQG